MRQTRNLPTMSIVIAVAATVGACNDQKPAQRDAYTSIGDCLADWRDYKLCQEMTEEDKRQAARSYGGGHSFFYWGPTYYGSRGSHMSGGGYVAPLMNRARSTAQYNSAKPAFSAPAPAARPSYNSYRPSYSSGSRSTSSPATAPASRGGFGATGRSVSVSS